MLCYAPARRTWDWIQHKLIYRPDNQSEFYHLGNGPRELRNVYGDQAYARPQHE
jgi:hypothetical protein